MSIYRIVPSESNPDVEYNVTLDRFGRWHCDCYSHVQKVSSGETDVKCKHIRKILLELDK